MFVTCTVLRAIFVHTTNDCSFVFGVHGTHCTDYNAVDHFSGPHIKHFDLRSIFVISSDDVVVDLHIVDASCRQLPNVLLSFNI